MNKKKLVFLTFIFFFLFFLKLPVKAQVLTEPRPCSLGYGCPEGLSEIYSQMGEKCVTSYEEFKKDPINNHFWIDDEEITAQGKADERARQFIHWVLSHPSIDSHPSIFTIWSNVRNVTYFFTLIVAAIFGLGLILNQRFNFSQKMEIWPHIFKLIGVLLFITFSASIVLTLIQLSDVLMKFFTETLGGKDIFNIYFSKTFDEKNYQAIFCKDLNYKVQESIKTELFLLKLTNVTYYVLGIMIILRKIVLWFLIFVSPFLALLLSFIFIRNIGFIWIGVFFQWLFYGPLLGLFIYALKVLWKNGIPFPFDFSRVGTIAGYIFPTGTTILYGGPAQRLSVVNSVNYIDTYAEYIISLVMLWAAIFFPWWLLRIFRDYCCDGIYATKNILMSIYDQLRGGPTPQPSPSPSPVFTSTALKIPKEIEVPVKVKLETIEEIKKAKTEEITKSLNLHVSKLTDIAHIETNKQIYQQITQNLNYLKNPMNAQTPTERQRYLHLRTELTNRAIRQDQIAQRIVSTISSSKIEQIVQKQQLAKTLPQAVPVTQVISFKTNLSIPQVQSIINNFANDTYLCQILSQKTNISQDTIQKTLTSFSQNINQHPLKIFEKVSEETKVPLTQVKTILTTFKETIKERPEIIEKVLGKEIVTKEKIEKIIERPIIEEKKIVEQTTPISITPQIQSTLNSLVANNSLHQIITQKTNISQDTIQKTLTSFSQNINQHPLKIFEKVSEETKVPLTQVKTILTTFKETIKERPEIIEKVLGKEIVTKEKIEKIIERPIIEEKKIVEQTTPISITPQIQSTLNSLVANNSLHQIITQKTNISQDTIQKTLTSFSQNINQHPLTIIDKVAEETKVSPEKVKTILITFKDTLKEKPELIEEVAKEEFLTPEKVKQVIELPIITEPEKNPEQIFSIPPSVSIEEYEEVKKMWMNQYEKGEVPVSENIKSRQDWVDQDIVFITNTLNKLLSPNEELRQQGLDDVGYILPIFLINNLSGEQLITYLRAKLEAAKQVKMMMEKEKEITQKLKEKSSEELVEVKATKKEEKAKAMAMEESLKEEEKNTQKLNIQEN
jgi:hypothetical protein